MRFTMIRFASLASLTLRVAYYIAILLAIMAVDSFRTAAPPNFIYQGF